jgi:hypothetical protein
VSSRAGRSRPPASPAVRLLLKPGRTAAAPGRGRDGAPGDGHVARPPPPPSRSTAPRTGRRVVRQLAAPGWPRPPDEVGRAKSASWSTRSARWCSPAATRARDVTPLRLAEVPRTEHAGRGSSFPAHGIWIKGRPAGSLVPEGPPRSFATWTGHRGPVRLDPLSFTVKTCSRRRTSVLCLAPACRTAAVGAADMLRWPACQSVDGSLDLSGSSIRSTGRTGHAGRQVNVAASYRGRASADRGPRTTGLRGPRVS